MFSEFTSLIISIALVCTIAVSIGVVSVGMYSIGQRTLMLSNIQVHVWKTKTTTLIENDGPYTVSIKYVIVGSNLVRKDVLLPKGHYTLLKTAVDGVEVCLPESGICKIIPAQEAPELYLTSAVSMVTKHGGNTKVNAATRGTRLHPVHIPHKSRVNRQREFNSLKNLNNVHSSPNRNSNSVRKSNNGKREVNNRGHVLSVNESITILERERVGHGYVWVPKVPINSAKSCGHEVVCIDISTYNPSEYSW